MPAFIWDVIASWSTQISLIVCATRLHSFNKKQEGEVFAEESQLIMLQASNSHRLLEH